MSAGTCCLLCLVHFVRKLNDYSAKFSDRSEKFSDRSGGFNAMGRPLSVQILSFPCSFRYKIIAPPEVGALSGKSWICHWTVKGGGSLVVHTSLPPERV